MVSRNPSISSLGFSFVLIILMVFSSFEIPSSAKYSHCTGMITESAAVSEFTVISPSEGEQSISMKSYSLRRGSSRLEMMRSRFSIFSISISAPTRSMWLGMMSSPSISVV